jgi:hypothetical protein
MQTTVLSPIGATRTDRPERLPGESTGSLASELDDPENFAQMRVDQDAGTVVWPNGLDLAPRCSTETMNKSTRRDSTVSRLRIFLPEELTVARRRRRAGRSR